jgi:hypothetical protein
MRLFKKPVFGILFIIGATFSMPLLSQNFGETSEHKKVWRIFGRKKHRDAYNPYVKNGKSTHEPSKEMAKENKRTLKQQDKALKKQIRKNKRATGMTK